MRPVLRYVVTRWDDVNGSEVVGELPSSEQACRIAFGLTHSEHCKNVSARGVWSNLDEEFAGLMKSIDERDQANRRAQAVAFAGMPWAEVNPAATVV